MPAPRTPAPGAWSSSAICTAPAQYLADGLRRQPEADELRRPLADLLDRLGRSDEARSVRQAAAGADSTQGNRAS
jgi:hypothetical protein